MKKKIMYALCAAALTCALGAQAQETATSQTRPEYVLPKQALTGEIMFYQLRADIALQRGLLGDAYAGYMQLARKTRDPRYAESALLVSAMTGNRELMSTAVAMLKELAPNATFAQTLLTQADFSAVRDAYANGDFKLVHDLLNSMLKEQPDQPMLLLMLADASERLGKSDEALSTLQRLVKLTPNDAEALNALGYFLVDKNLRLNEAATYLNRAHQLSPNAGHIVDSLAWLAYRQNRLDDALKLAKQAYEWSDQNDVRIHLAEIYWAKGLRDTAMDLFADTYLDEPESALLKSTVKRLGIDDATLKNAAQKRLEKTNAAHQPK